MTMRVNGPDGLVVNFPDGTDEQTIDRVMREAMAKRQSQNDPAGVFTGEAAAGDHEFLIRRDLPYIERAFMKAHKAGDTNAAAVLAREVKRQRAAPGSNGMTLDQQKAIALASARKRMAEAKAQQGNKLFEMQTPDGRSFEVEAPDMQTAASSLQQFIEVEGPDGVIAEFPAGTSEAVIKGAMAKRYGSPQQPLSKLQSLRVKFPQYNDMSDRQFADALHRKFYSDMPFDDFASKAGLALPSRDGPQEPNIGAKGNMRPGDRVGTNVAGRYLNSATVGWGDEIIAGLGTPIDMAVNAFTGEGPTDPGEAYSQIRAFQNAERAATYDQKPGMAAAADIGGAFMPAGAGARYVMQAPGLLNRTVRSAGVGAGLGGIAGFGEGESLAERGTNAAVGGSTGFFTGMALPGTGQLAGKAFQGAKSIFRGAFAPARSLANTERFAASKVAEAYGRDMLTPQRVSQKLASNLATKGDLVPADVAGKNTASLLRAAANIPSRSREALTRGLAYRQDRQLDRIRADVGKAFGDPKDFMGTVESLTLNRKNAAKPLFDEAFNTPTPYTMTLENVLNRPLMKTLVERAQVSAANRGEQFRGIFIDRAGNAKRVPDTEALHRVKMEIDDLIGRMRKREETGLGNVSIRDLTILKRDYVNAINNPKYKAALKRYAGDSAAMNAIDEGYQEGLSMEPKAIRKALSSLPSGDADLWRMGFARRIVEQLRDTGRAGANRADVLYSPKYLDRMRAAFRDVPSGREFMQRLNLERRMARTRQAVEGNSTTAQQLTEGMEAGNDAMQNLDLAMKISRGDAVGAVVNGLGRARNAMTGMRPDVADSIIRQLTSRDPAVAKRAQELIQRELAKQNRRKGTPQRVQAITNLGGFAALPYFATGGGQQPQQYPGR